MNNLRTLIDNILVPHSAFEEATRRMEQCFSHANGSMEPICIALIGDTRTGKTRVLTSCQARHPTLRTPEGLVVPILRIRTPPNPTVKGIAGTFLYAMGAPDWDKGTETARTNRILTLLREVQTRMLMVDEFQHFYDKKSHKVWHHVADWLKVLVDESKAALVVAGLQTCRAVIDQNEQLAGRFLTPLHMPRFDWAHDEHRGQFVGILHAFYEQLSAHFDLPVLSDEDTAFRMYCATGGLMGYLAKILRQCVWNTIDADARKIEFEDIRVAAQQAVWEEESAIGIPNPFDRTHSFSPTTELLALVRRLGTRNEPVEYSRARHRGRATQKPPSVATILAA